MSDEVEFLGDWVVQKGMSRPTIPATWRCDRGAMVLSNYGEVLVRTRDRLRAVGRGLSGEEAPLLLTLSWMASGYWRLSGLRGPAVVPAMLFFSRGRGSSNSRHHVVPALEGVTDPLKAAAIIAEAVLGGEE